MTAVSQLNAASFAGITFPYTSCRVSIEQRHHVHVYLHTPGGEVEKLGAALRRFRFEVPAQDTLTIAPYKSFYSVTLPKLWAVLESGATADLRVPSVGTVRAFSPSAERTLRVMMQSGESVELSFLEDSTTLSTLSAVFTPSTEGMATQLTRFVRAAEPIVPTSLLDRLALAVNELLVLRDQGALLARIVEAKAEGVIALCTTLYRLPALGQPSALPALDLLLELQLAAVLVKKDSARRGRPVLTRTLPSRMAAAQVSAWLYPTAGSVKAAELLALNDWPDPLNIERGSTVRFYASS